MPLKRLVTLLTLLCLLALPLSGLSAVEQPPQKRAVVKELTTSVIIPCDVLHLRHLFALLEHFQDQSTVHPDEVVISLSNIGDGYREEVERLEQHTWPFLLRIITHKEKKSAGANRNTAAYHAHGDVIICQDADDLPHPQRVEIIKHMFQNYEIDHLLHLFISYHKSFMPYELNDIRISTFSSLNEMRDYWDKNGCCVHNGNVSFNRELIQRHPFPDANLGEDVQFNQTVYSSKRSVIVFAKLVMYRANLSSITPNVNWPADVDF